MRWGGAGGCSWRTGGAVQQGELGTQGDSWGGIWNVGGGRLGTSLVHWLLVSGCRPPGRGAQG